MENARLNPEKPEITIAGREDKMSVEILSATLIETGSEELKLEVIDENGFLLYSKTLTPEPVHPNAVLVSSFPEVAINKRFIFSSFITIKINASSENPFQIEVQYT